MPRLVLGPLLRHTDGTTATVWVETDAPGEVRVDAGGRVHAARTFTVHGHHYALVEVTGLEPGTATPYTVELDGKRVWPEPGSPFPPSRLRTPAPDGPLRLVFGSCRTSRGHDATCDDAYGVDMLCAYAHRLARAADEEWPAALLLLGDQVYADETSAAMREFIRARRDLDTPPGAEVADFAEYAHLYRLAWSEPAVRWLLSTVPTWMIFDDHDVRDDWNTSAAWRAWIAEQPWWRGRITGGLAAYWIYQHLGNLSPAERAADPVLAALRETPGDAGPVLDEFAWRADQEPGAYRWSYARDFGSTRLVVLDTRCGRRLDPGARDILPDATWKWFDAQATGGIDHLLVASTLPYLLPRAVHEVERWSEAVGDGAWGRWATGPVERIRQALDLEHWGAFRRSFDAMARLVTEVAAGRRGPAPATVSFLSGDVHFSYLARVLGIGPAQVYQVVCSPIRNPLSPALRRANSLALTGPARFGCRVLAATARAVDTPIDWVIERGPWYDNALATLDIAGRSCALRWETVRGRVGSPFEALAAVRLS
ncbi:glycoside hydrolase [Carbonactinospora thermoautotrophica]|uniref:alkaline phosphatase D family protein n=1 Tax=Carbonactinospora thermoautotrophica TaxID=1469144 RepID=UPI0022710EF5|nr:alkaline phosphatase D family protein [Carbonactinospora thermoautotrophica]MCX9192449.1 glycoside hydrolase [Carbonactinospora thermoautotrophica]